MIFRLLYIMSSAVVASLATYFGAYLMHDNAEVVTVLITTYTVFAGFLVAIITILGDPSLLAGGNWRESEVHRENLERRLIKHFWLFIMYLSTIGLIFLGSLLKKADGKQGKIAIQIVEHTYFWLAVFAFLMTMALPKMLSDIQRARGDVELGKKAPSSTVPSSNNDPQQIID